MESLDPNARRWVFALGVLAALCEWASALGAHGSTGRIHGLLLGGALFPGIMLLFGGFLRPGGLGRAAFLGNLRACAMTYGSVFLGALFYQFGLVKGLQAAVLVLPILSLAAAVRQTWPPATMGARLGTKPPPTTAP